MDAHAHLPLTQPHQEDTVRCRAVVRATDVTVYKLIAGGSEATLSAYNESCSNISISIHPTPPSHQHHPTCTDDWRGMYTQFLTRHALGTLPYRWEGGHTEARLVAITFLDPLDIIVVSGALLHDGGISGATKASAVKRELGIDPSKPLLPALADCGKALLVREIDDWWELVIPHALLARLACVERGVAVFRRWPGGIVPLTHMWRLEGEAEVRWRSWVDEEDAARCIPDLGMEWLP